MTRAKEKNEASDFTACTPVAWRWRYRDLTDWYYQTSEPIAGENIERDPLYTSSPLSSNEQG